MKKVLLFGANGQVGTELHRTLTAPDFAVTCFDRASVDLTNADRLRDAIRHAAPDIVINAAAYTAVDKAESEPELAHAVNALAPAIMADECRKLDALLVHYSTDYVFDGTKRTPYVETDPVCPINIYGETKLAGEQSITASGCRHWIVRVAWVYSAHGKNFLLTILRLAREGKSLRIVDDQIGVPTSARSIAEVTARGLLHSESVEGLFHFSLAGMTSWYGFAKEILVAFHIQGVEVEPIPTSSYPTAARRPAYSVLESGTLKAALGIEFISWQQELQRLSRGMLASASVTII